VTGVGRAAGLGARRAGTVKRQVEDKNKHRKNRQQDEGDLLVAAPKAPTTTSFWSVSAGRSRQTGHGAPLSRVDADSTGCRRAGW